MRKVVHHPAMDALEKWREWSVRVQRKFEGLETLSVRLKIKRSKSGKPGLYAGAAILIGTGGRILNQPLDPSKTAR